jgi:hypothetical protein
MNLRWLAGIAGAIFVFGSLSDGGAAAQGNGPQSVDRAAERAVELAQSRWVMGCGSRYRYRGLIRRLYIPRDRRRYGHCHEWGLWQGRSYRGYRHLPRGYWVWRAPYWYIYARRGVVRAGPGPRPGRRYGRGCRGSRWAYSGLMRRLYLPRDRRRYGRCREWGIWTGRSYRGHHNLPRGYWVWHAPYWYIYRRRFVYR